MQTKRKQHDNDEQTNRLHNMLVHEVSIVDRPANKRRFLVVKRSEDMGATELVDDGRGGLVEASKQGEPKPTDEGMPDDEKAKAKDKDKDDDKIATGTESEKAKQLPPGAPGGPPAPGGKPDDDDEEDDDKKPKPPAPPFGGKGEDAKKAIGEAAEKLSAIVEAIKAAGVDVDDEMQAKITAATKALDALKDTDFAPSNKSDDEPGSADIGEALKSAGADDDTIGAINKLLARSGASIEKAGARMAKERLERFRKAMELLQSLLKEFSPIDDAKIRKGDDANALLLAGLDPAFVAKFADNAKANPELIAKIEQLTDLVAKQNARLDKVTKTAGRSNVIPLERQSNNDAEDVAWPLDMNRPITRDTVDKDVSFFDVE